MKTLTGGLHWRSARRLAASSLVYNIQNTCNNIAKYKKRNVQYYNTDTLNLFDTGITGWDIITVALLCVQCQTILLAVSPDLVPQVLSLEDLDLIWSAQDGKHEIIVKNIHDMLVKLAWDFSAQQLDYLFGCFQVQGRGEVLQSFVQYGSSTKSTVEPPHINALRILRVCASDRIGVFIGQD